MYVLYRISVWWLETDVSPPSEWIMFEIFLVCGFYSVFLVVYFDQYCLVKHIQPVFIKVCGRQSVSVIMWVSEWVSEWMSEWERESGWVSEWMNESGWVSESVSELVSQRVSGIEEWYLSRRNVRMHSLFRKSSGTIVMSSCCPAASFVTMVMMHIGLPLDWLQQQSPWAVNTTWVELKINRVADE